MYTQNYYMCLSTGRFLRPALSVALINKIFSCLY